MSGRHTTMWEDAGIAGVRCDGVDVDFVASAEDERHRPVALGRGRRHGARAHAVPARGERVKHSRRTRAKQWREAARRFWEHGTQQTAQWWFDKVSPSLRAEMFDVYIAYFYPVEQRGYSAELRAMVCLMCAAITDPPRRRSAPSHQGEGT